MATNCSQLKMQSADSKFYKTDVAYPETFEDSKKVAKQGGIVAKVARKELEAKTGKKVITSLNAKSASQLKSSDSKKKTNNASKQSNA